MKKSRLWHKRKRTKAGCVYSQSDINKVMFHQDFVGVIGDYVGLKKTRSNYIGRCPFCKPFTENARHFIVSEKKELYKCFECGAGGSTVSSFLMRYYGRPFGDVLELLNKTYGPGISLYPIGTRSLKSRPCKDDNLPF
jgi:DNA primase